MAILGSLVHYLLVFVILVAVAVLGIFAGKNFSDRKNAKKVAADGETEEVK